MPAFSQETLEHALLARAAETKTGDTRLLRVRLIEGEGSDGEPAWFVELVLSNPPKKLGTWPVDDLWTLRRIVRDTIAEIDGDVRWFVTFEPEEAAELDATDTKDRVEA